MMASAARVDGLLEAVKAAGGVLRRDGDMLEIEAAAALPEELLTRLREEKSAVLMAPRDNAVSECAWSDAEDERVPQSWKKAPAPPALGRRASHSSIPSGRRATYRLSAGADLSTIAAGFSMKAGLPKPLHLAGARLIFSVVTASGHSRALIMPGFFGS